MSNNPVLSATARLAHAHARTKQDPAEIDQRRRELTEAKLRRAVDEALAADPALTAETRESIARLLMNGGE